MLLGQRKRAVGIFATHLDVEKALKNLGSTSFPMAQISVVAKDTGDEGKLGESDPHYWIRYQSTGRGIGATIAGSLLGALGGCVIGLGIFSVPGANLHKTLGPSETVLITLFAGAGVGAVGCTTIAALAGSRTTSVRYRVDSDRNSQCKYLVIVGGTDEEVRRAESILTKLNAERVLRF